MGKLGVFGVLVLIVAWTTIAEGKDKAKKDEPPVQRELTAKEAADFVIQTVAATLTTKPPKAIIKNKKNPGKGKNGKKGKKNGKGEKKGKGKGKKGGKKGGKGKKEPKLDYGAYYYAIDDWNYRPSDDRNDRSYNYYGDYQYRTDVYYVDDGYDNYDYPNYEHPDYPTTNSKYDFRYQFSIPSLPGMPRGPEMEISFYSIQKYFKQFGVDLEETLDCIRDNVKDKGVGNLIEIVINNITAQMQAGSPSATSAQSGPTVRKAFYDFLGNVLNNTNASIQAMPALFNKYAPVLINSSMTFEELGRNLTSTYFTSSQVSNKLLGLAAWTLVETNPTYLYLLAMSMKDLAVPVSNRWATDYLVAVDQPVYGDSPVMPPIATPPKFDLHQDHKPMVANTGNVGSDLYYANSKKD